MGSPLLLLATAYRTFYNITGSYLTARLAPNRPMGHALAVGVVGLAACIAGAVAQQGVGPSWYLLALVVLALPCAWAGGKLYILQSRADSNQLKNPVA